MQEIQPREQAQLPRVEAADEPGVNKALFTLYSNLIGPLADIEKTAAEISAAKQAIAECSGAVTYSRASAAMNTLKKIPKTFIIMTVTPALFYSTAINWLIEDSGLRIPEILGPALDPGIIESLECFAVLSILLCFFTEFTHAASATRTENKYRKKHAAMPWIPLPAWNQACSRSSRLRMASGLSLRNTGPRMP